MRLGGFLSFIFHLAIALLILFGLPDLFKQEEIQAPVAVQLATLADITATPKPQPTPAPAPQVKQETPPPPAPAPPVPATPPAPEPPQPVEQTPPPPEPTPPPPTPPAPQQPAEQTPPEPVPIPEQQPTPPPPQEAKLEAPPPPLLRPPVPPDKPKPKPAQQQTQDFNSLLKNVLKTTPSTQPQPDQPPQPQPDQSASAISGPQLTTSEKDAVASQMRGCWYFDAGAQGVGQMTVDIHVVLAPDGTVKSVQADGGTRMLTDPVYRSFVEATVRAVWKCNPLHVPLDKYDAWKELLLHFDPSGMIG